MVSPHCVVLGRRVRGPGRGMATAIRGQFFAAPEPVIEMADPSPQTLAEKRAFEAERLAAWF